MSKFNIISDITVPMFGSFTKEFPEQFITKRKNNVIHLFTIIGVNDDGIQIKSMLDKHVDNVAFAEITKIKSSTTGEVVKIEQYDAVDKAEIKKYFLETDIPDLLLFDTEFKAIKLVELRITKGEIILLDEVGTAFGLDKLLNQTKLINLG